MTTKERILEKALELFNQEGSDAVTVRHIAKELGMSHGNLCYHFPTTDAIIQSLYLQLVAELDALILIEEGKMMDITLLGVIEMSKSSFSILYKYRFILLDFVRIMRRIPEIKTHYRQLTKIREQQFQYIINELIHKKVFRAPIFEHEYTNWIHSAILFGDFWISSAEILYEGDEDKKVDTYHKIFITMTLPYLTQDGLNNIEAFS